MVITDWMGTSFLFGSQIEERCIPIHTICIQKPEYWILMERHLIISPTQPQFLISFMEHGLVEITS